MGISMNNSDLTGILEFLRSTEQLKNTIRNARTSNGREESTAEHTWRLCLMALLFEEQFSHLDILRLIKICIIHDLGEVIGGDIPATDENASKDKSIQERKDLAQLIHPLSESLQVHILELWDEYENASSEEAMIAKALDKLETILQHTQGKNPKDFNYGFNMSYGKKYTDQHELTARLREMIDQDTHRLATENGTI